MCYAGVKDVHSHRPTQTAFLTQSIVLLLTSIREVSSSTAFPSSSPSSFLVGSGWCRDSTVSLNWTEHSASKCSVVNGSYTPTSPPSKVQGTSWVSKQKEWKSWWMWRRDVACWLLDMTHFAHITSHPWLPAKDTCNLQPVISSTDEWGPPKRHL